MEAIAAAAGLQGSNPPLRSHAKKTSGSFRQFLSCRDSKPAETPGRSSRRWAMACNGARTARCDDSSRAQFETLGYENWEASEAIARKANRVEIPLSLRIIKKKKQCVELGLRNADRQSDSCSVSKALCSMLSIVRLMCSCSLPSRDVAGRDAMEQRVRIDLCTSFVLIFQKVLSRTPSLMIDLMLLFGNFPPLTTARDEKDEEVTELVSAITKGGLRVELEPDDYEEYLSTELSYRMNLARDPNNAMLLSNYAQFMYLVIRDYYRAEVYFKKAVEAEPSDADSLSRYASFLWAVRKDVWAAEEVYQQAIAAEPDSTFHASNYASFLWSTGGGDTCFLHP